MLLNSDIADAATQIFRCQRTALQFKPYWSHQKDIKLIQDSYPQYGKGMWCQMRQCSTYKSLCSGYWAPIVAL